MRRCIAALSFMPIKGQFTQNESRIHEPLFCACHFLKPETLRLGQLPHNKYTYIPSFPWICFCKAGYSSMMPRKKNIGKSSMCIHRRRQAQARGLCPPRREILLFWPLKRPKIGVEPPPGNWKMAESPPLEKFLPTPLCAFIMVIASGYTVSKEF